MRPSELARPSHRHGAGRALLSHLARRAAARRVRCHPDGPRRHRGGHRPRQERLDVLARRRASVQWPRALGAAGRPSLLQRRSGQGWSTIDRATTRAGGGFRFAFRPQQSGGARLRVRVDAARREIGRLNV